jgi:hypothetical protein
MHIFVLAWLTTSFANQIPLHTTQSTPKNDVMMQWSDVWHALTPLTSSFRGLSEPMGAFVPDLNKYFDEIARNTHIQGGNDAWKSFLNDTFPSDVADGGFANWLRCNTSSPLEITVDSSAVNEELLKGFYGLMGVEFKTYFVGNAWIPLDGYYQATQSIIAKWMWIDGKRFVTESGSTVGKWRGSVVWLKRGWHTVLVATITYGNDVVRLRLPLLELVNSSITLVETDVIVPQVLQNQVTGNWFSLVVTPLQKIQELQVDIFLTVKTDSENDYETMTTVVIPWPIQAGQPFPVTLPIPSHKTHLQKHHLDLETLRRLDKHVMDELWSDDVSGHVWLRAIGHFGRKHPVFHFARNLTVQSFEKAHGWIMPFLDDDGTVDVASVVAPLEPCRACPVIITMHGAGVSSISNVWTESYRRQSKAWILFPMNRREFGWNWEGKGARGTWSALEYLHRQTTKGGLGISERGVDVSRLYYTGHSMGGHGTLVLASSHPDYAVGYAPCSGWLTQTLYLPSYLYTDFFTMSFSQRAAFENQAGGVGEMGTRLENVVGLRGVVRMGTIDDVVPSFNLRRWYRHVKAFEGEWQVENGLMLSEVAEQGHWWGDVVDDDVMQRSFDSLNTVGVSPLPRKFVLQTQHLASMGTKAGFRILQTTKPGLARMDFTKEKMWKITTRNVRRFTWVKPDGLDYAKTISVDGHVFKLRGGDVFLKTCGDNPWHVEQCHGTFWKRDTGHFWRHERTPDTSGPMSTIHERPLVVFADADVAMELILDMYARTRSAIVVDEYKNRKRYQGWNHIYVGRAPSDQSLVQINKRGFSLQLPAQTVTFESENHAGLFLIPLGSDEKHDVYGKHLRQAIGIIVLGNSRKALESAIYWLPTFAAARIPDWIVLKGGRGMNPMGWRGMGGVEMLGHWDHSWRAISEW